MHEQVTMLQKLLSHIFEQYADVQDDSYISDEDIEEYLETFMQRPCIMPTNVQGPVQPQQPEVAQVQPHRNTEQRLEQGLRQIRRVLFLSEIEREDEPMPLDGINLNHKSSIYHRHIEHFFHIFGGSTVFSLISESTRRL